MLHQAMPPRPPVIQTGPAPSESSTASLPDHGRVWVHQNSLEEVRNNRQPRKLPLRRTNSAASFKFGHMEGGASLAETESCTDQSSHSGRGGNWAWKEAILVENGSRGVVVKLVDAELENDMAPESTVMLPFSAWNQGNIVLANEFDRDPQTGFWQPPDDLITLTHLHEPAVVESLQHRFAADKIYTDTGPVLLAINPFQTIQGVYGESIQKRYWEKAEQNLTTDLPPHVYAIADMSFRSMMRALEDEKPADQSILVSGESGAGKTVTTKFVMKYLAALSQRSSVIRTQDKRAYLKVAESKQQASSVPSLHRRTPSRSRGFQQPSWSTPTKSPTRSNAHRQEAIDELANATILSKSSQDSIEAIVLQSNPILESFGNARTLRNDNSSRFGKFIEIQFSETGKLVGANIDTYLLEKVRLCRQLPGERNFHVFYELLNERDELPTMYFIAPTALPEDFRLLCSSGTYDRRDGVVDADTYRSLRSAMGAMGFPLEEIQNVFGVTAAILHASNLNFFDLGDETSALDEGNVHLQPVCHLLGVTEEELNYALTSFTITAGKTYVLRALNVEQAEKGLQALLQTTYGALFQYLVLRINESIAYKRRMSQGGGDDVDEDGFLIMGPASSAKIGVLDIFGFESFQKNSFEQLCINFCNEALQQQFNAFVLKNEQAIYEKEGIEWSFIEFPENQDVLDLIEKRGSGILSILDDQCRAPGPSDKAFAMNLYNQCKKHPRFTVSRKQSANLQFSVSHYAGPVEYTTEGFIEKNKDDLPKEITELLKTSSLPFVQELAFIMEPEDADMIPDKGSNKFQRAGSFVGRATVGGQFRSQLRNLREKIEQTSPHYIRCLKPNDLLIPEVFDTAIVAEQLRCGGILEAVRVARAGFTQHYPHVDFVRRYRSLAWRELASGSSTSSASSNTNGWNGGGGINRSGSFRSSGRGLNRSGSFRSSHGVDDSQNQKPDSKSVDPKAQCRELVKVLYRKLRQLETDTSDEVEGSSGSSSRAAVAPPSSPAARAKSYSYQQSPQPAWRNSPLVKKKTTIGGTPPVAPMPLSSPSQHKNKRNPPPAMTPPKATASTPWKRGAHSASDYLKVGIQIGKTKVFLRHHCFENLERLRSIEQTKAATKLNSIFRRYLARIAYLPFRDAFRREMAHHGFTWGDEKKDDYDFAQPNHFRDSRLNMGSSVCFSVAYDCSFSLVDKWQDSMIRDAIHNPVPRNEWGKQMPSNMNFKWLLQDGIWVKNYAAAESPAR